MTELADGIELGSKLGMAYRNSSMQSELKDANKVDQSTGNEYTPEQIQSLNDTYGPKAGETWNADMGAYEDASGGLRGVTGPSVSDKGVYTDDATGVTTAPRTQYRLGDRTQDTAFTADDIAQHKLGLKADIYSNYGKEDMAESMRNNASSRAAQAQQIKLGQVQLEDANLKLGYAQNEAKLFKIRHDLSTGKITEDEAMTALVDATDPMHKDGITHGFKKLGDGTYEVTQMKNNNVVGSQQGVTFDSAFGEALKYANPQNYKEAKAEAYRDKRDAVADSQSDRTFGLQLSKAEAETAHMILQDKELTRKNTADIEYLQNKYKLDVKELALKGLLTNAQVGAYNASAAKDRSVSNAYKNITYAEDGTAMELFAGKTGGMQVRPVTTEDGKPFKGSTKGTGIKDNTKAQEAYYKFITENPNAKPEELSALQRNLGLAPPLNFDLSKKDPNSLAPQSDVVPTNKHVDVTSYNPQIAVSADPLTGEDLTPEEYHRKYGEWPKGTGLATRIFNR
jgi:hypothetical protein